MSPMVPPINAFLNGAVGDRKVGNSNGGSTSEIILHTPGVPKPSDEVGVPPILLRCVLLAPSSSRPAVGGRACNYPIPIHGGCVALPIYPRGGFLPADDYPHGIFSGGGWS